jgi:hypothetical protein
MSALPMLTKILITATFLTAYVCVFNKQQRLGIFIAADGDNCSELQNLTDVLSFLHALE